MNYKRILLVAACLLLPLALCAGERIVATAAPANTQLVHGSTVDIPVNIDISKLPERLGSFTATLTWDARVLEFQGFSGGSTAGFQNPVVNDAETGNGKLVFANAYAQGSKGTANILNLNFKVIGTAGSSTSLSLSFSAMAAALTFQDLLPYLEAQEQSIQLTVEEVPGDYEIGNFPNPFNPSTEIRYKLPQVSDVQIVIFNVLGQKVRQLVNSRQNAGTYAVRWEGDNDQGVAVPSGMYFLRMKAGDFLADRKLLFLK